MDIIDVFYEKDSKITQQVTYYSSSWYHKPSILRSIAAWFDRNSKDGQRVAFVCSSKYGCRQFLPEISKIYPVHNMSYCHYRGENDWLVPEFNDCALSVYGD